MMALLSWIIIGLLVGWLKRFFLPGRPGGFAATLVLAVIGALVGGYVATYFNEGNLATLQIGALAVALLGALLMLLVAAKLRI